MSGSYKYCVVPKCTSTTVATPDKLFIHVPKDVKQRKAWLTAMRRADPLSNKTTAFVCEEHFNLEQDMENYIRFQIMKEGPIRLHPGVIPHKFKCQQSQTTAHIKAPRQSSLKRKHQAMVQDLLSQPQPCTSSTPDFDEELPESDFIDEVQVGEDPILSSDEDYASIMEVKEVVATAKKSTDTHHLRTTKQCKKLLQNMKTERKNYYDTGNMGDLHLSTSLQPTNSGTPTLLQSFDHGTKCVKARRKLVRCVDRRQYYLSFKTNFIFKS
ncbi:uncharacterized protein LOC103506596 isoform X1 [Diaphorina citri]|uniref:Uncharacterized protein LOC103506596 isoform X1 n=1 Tax=Diaphorina citri TaxID=121845 RepID=A0A3Q0IMH4_DIACI|nr:uncharacterized protein LOC103506596 isoform X1 [Diaphorina citri]